MNSFHLSMTSQASQLGGQARGQAPLCFGEEPPSAGRLRGERRHATPSGGRFVYLAF